MRARPQPSSSFLCLLWARCLRHDATARACRLSSLFISPPHSHLQALGVLDRRARRCAGGRCRELPPGVRGGEPRSDWLLAPVVRGGGSSRGLPVFVGFRRPSERGKVIVASAGWSPPPLPLRVVYDPPCVGSREAPVS